MVNQLVAYGPAQSKLAVTHDGELHLIDASATDYSEGSKWSNGQVKCIDGYGEKLLVAQSDGKLFLVDDLGSAPIAELPGEEIQAAFLLNELIAVKTLDSLKLFRPTGRMLEAIPTSRKILDVEQLDDQQLLFATDAGLYKLSETGFKAVEAAGKQAETLRREYINGLLTTADGALWAGSTRSGVYRMPQQCRSVLHFPGELFADKVVWAVAETPHGIAVGSSNGLDLFSCEASWHFPSFDPETKWTKQAQFKGFHVSGLHYREGKLWVATRNSGLRCFEKKPEGWRERKDLLREVEGGIYDLDVNEEGQVVLSTGEGLYLFQVNQTALTLIKPHDLISQGRVGNYTHQALQVSSDLYFSGSSGLYRYKLEEQEIAHLSKASSPPIPLEITTGMQLDANGKLWVGTMGKGLVRVDTASFRIEAHFDEEQGLSNAVIYGIEPWGNGLLVSSNRGLSMLHPEGINNFAEDEGIPFPEHSLGASGSLGPKQNPWFGGVDGFYLLCDEALQGWHDLPQPLISEVFVNYEAVKATWIGERPAAEKKHLAATQSASSHHEIELFPGDNVLSLKALLPGVFSDDYTMQYRLLGVYDEWIELKGNNERMVFTTLPGGMHTLEVAVVQKGGGQVQSPLRIKLVVHPPFWKTTWFLALCGFLLVTLTVLIVRIRGRRKLQKEVLKRQATERVREERERISMDLHDNIGAQITHVIAGLDNLSYTIGNKDAHGVVQKIDQLSEFSRGTMQQLRDTIWTLSKEEITLEAFVRRVRDYMVRMLADRDTPVFSISEHSHEAVLLRADITVHLFRLLQECVTNTLKHAEASKIHLQIRYSAKTLELIYHDDGKGFNMDEPGGRQDAYGLRNMVARVERMGGSCSIQSKIGAGCEVEVKIPL